MFVEITPVVIALVGSAGFWGYLSIRAKNKDEAEKREAQRRKEYKDKEDARNREFNEAMKLQIEALNTKVDTLLAEKDHLLRSLADVKADLSAARATIAHLESIIRLRPDISIPPQVRVVSIPATGEPNVD